MDVHDQTGLKRWGDGWKRKIKITRVGEGHSRVEWDIFCVLTTLLGDDGYCGRIVLPLTYRLDWTGSEAVAGSCNYCI